MIYFRIYYQILEKLFHIKNEFKNTTIYNLVDDKESNAIIIKFKNVQNIVDKLSNKGYNINKKISKDIKNCLIYIPKKKWVQCQGVFYISGNINNTPIKLWYKIIHKNDKYQIHIIKFPYCNLVKKSDHISISKNENEIKLKIYNAIKNELFELLKDIIYLIHD